jgi:hypothetical protein
MASDENRPTTISAALSIIDHLKRERDEAREKCERFLTAAASDALEIDQLKALCLEAADWLEAYVISITMVTSGRRHPTDEERIKRLRETGK